MKRLILAVPCAVIALMASACVSGGKPVELSQEAACLGHFENDPLGADRCRMPAESRSDSVPDVTPQQLPIRTGQYD